MVTMSNTNSERTNTLRGDIATTLDRLQHNTAPDKFQVRSPPVRVFHRQWDSELPPTIRLKKHHGLTATSVRITKGVSTCANVVAATSGLEYIP